MFADARLVQKKVAALLKDLDSILNKLHADSLVLNYGTRVTVAKPVDLVRVLASWPYPDQVELTLRNILLSSILSAEKRQVGAGLVCAQSLVQGCPQNSQQTVRGILDRRVEPKIIDDTLNYFLGAGKIYSLMRKIIESGGLSATLDFDTTPSNDFVVQASATKEVLGEVHPLFTAKSELHRLHRVTILAIDGKIESIGEIDHLLQALAYHKVNAIFCARGFAPDVVVTLDKNWKSGNLKAIPFRVEEWEVNQQKGINNELKTLETCKKLDIKCVSAEMGESFKETTIDDFTTHSHVIFSKQGLALECDSGLSQYIEIRVPERMSNMIGIISDRCQLAQKACIGVAKFGICDSYWQDGGKKERPHGILVSHNAQIIGELAARSCQKILENLGGIVVGEK